MNSTTAPTKQIQSVGDMVGYAFAAFRANLGLIFKCQLMPVTGLLAGRTALQYCLSNLPRKAEASAYLSWATQNGAILGVGLLLIMIFGIFMMVRQLALGKYLSGLTSTYEESLASVNKKIWKLVGLGFVGLFVAVGAIFVLGLMIGGSVALTKAGPALLVLSGLMMMSATTLFCLFIFFATLVFHIMYLVLACENVGVFESLGKGCKLVFFDFFRAAWFSFVLFICIALIAYPMELPVVIVGAAAGAHHAMSSSEPFHMPMYLLIPIEVWTSLVSMVTYPINIIAFAFFYCDMRNRQEGLDLHRKLVAFTKSDDTTGATGPLSP